MFCQVESEQVVAVHDVSSTYHVPMLLEKQGMVPLLQRILHLDALTLAPSLVKKGANTWHAWKLLTGTQDHHYQTVTIALVGKYTNLHDSYLSVIKSLEHAAMSCSRKLHLIWVDASHLETATNASSPAEFHKAWHEVCTAQGILVPGGFGHRGTEGMVAAACWARKNKTPYLGICLGMQIAVIEFARNVCNLPKAGSIELEERTPDPVVIYMPEIDRKTLGGTMRLGLRPTHFQAGTEWSKLRSLYGKPHPEGPTVNDENVGVNGANSTTSSTTCVNAPVILERHRHRYEVNPEYIERLTAHGLSFVGKDDRGERMEILELKDHPWFVGVQFHPEYLSRVLEPSKPYLGFVAASAGCLDEVIFRAKRSLSMSSMVNGDRIDELLVNGMDGVKI